MQRRFIYAAGSLLVVLLIGLAYLHLSTRPSTHRVATSETEMSATTQATAAPVRASAASLPSAATAKAAPVLNFTTTNWTSVTPDPSPLQGEETWAGRQRRATAIIAGSPTIDLRSLKSGDRIAFPVRLGPPVVGIVQLVMPDDLGWVRIGGKLENDPSGHFSLNQRGNELNGQLLLLGRDTGYILEGTAPNALVLNEYPIDSLVCFNFDSNAKPAGQAGADASAGEAGAEAGAPAGTWPTITVPSLDSLPSAIHVLYLDFDGAIVTDPDWNGGLTIDAPPPTIGADPITADFITKVWKRVAEDFRPFNISVTTIETRYTDALPGKRMRCVVTSNDEARPGVGGVAYLTSFRNGGGPNFSSTIPCWCFTRPYYDDADVSSIISHELGHTMGLAHDGQTYPSRTYYPGHGSGLTSWGPIMGTTYGVTVSQWSRGEYADANNFEDDLAIIGGTANGFFPRSDEAVNNETGTDLPNTGVFDFEGTVTSANDTEYLRFSTPGGSVSLTANPAALEPNLDLQLELRTSDGATVLRSSNPNGAVPASINTTLAAGSYLAVIRPSGFGTPQDGYSSYGSIGEYRLSGTFPAVPDDPPLVITPPQDTAVAINGTAVFSVEAISNIKITYQWTKNDVPIRGQTRPTLTLRRVQPAHQAAYRCIVTNLIGSTISDPAVLTVNYRPVFTQHPVSSTVNSGDTATFVADAHGTPDLQWQWQFNGIDIPGATDRILEIPNAVWANAGLYRCVASNPYGTTIGRYARLTVRSAPVVLIEPPATQLIPLNSSATITLRAAGTGTLRYQWFKNGEPIPRATSYRLRLTRISPESAGSYHCVITNTLGSTISATCQAIVQDVPVIIDPLDSAVVARGRRHRLSVGVVGAPRLTYQWTKDGLPVRGTTYALTVVPTADADYQVTISNGFGQTVSTIAHLTVHDVPRVVTHPVSQIRPYGGDVTFTVAAEGTAPFTYQWFRGRTPLEGATSDTLTLTDLQKPNATTYYCQITNDVGTVKSRAARLTLHTTPSWVEEPVDTVVDQYGTATLSSRAAGSATLRYQWMKDGTDIYRATGRTYRITNAQPGVEGSYSVRVRNAVGEIASSAAIVTLNTVKNGTFTDFQPKVGKYGHYLRILGTDLNWTTGVRFQGYSGRLVAASFAKVSGSELIVTIPYGAQDGPITLITRTGNLTSTSTFQVYWTNDTNDYFVYGRVIPPAGGTMSGTNYDFTSEYYEPAHAETPAAFSAWYQWTPSVSGGYILRTTRATFDTRLAAYRGDAMWALSTVAYNDDENPLRNIRTSKIFIDAKAGTTYRIAVDGFYTSPYWEMGSYKLVVSRLAASAPLASSEDQPWVGTPSAAPAPAGQVVLGGNGQEADLVWLPSSAAADSDCLEARARLSWVAEEGSRDQFGIIAYDTAEEPMFGVNVSTADGSVSLLHPDSHTSRTEQTLISDEAQDITLHLDQDRGTWRASLNGVWIGDEQPIPEGRTFAEMGAQWLPGHGGGRSAVVLQEAEVTAGDHAAP